MPYMDGMGLIFRGHSFVFRGVFPGFHWRRAPPALDWLESNGRMASRSCQEFQGEEGEPMWIYDFF